MRNNNLNLHDIGKILIIRLSSLGDILLVTPILRSLKASNPKLKIDFLVREEYSDALKYNPNLNNLFELTSNNAFKSLNEDFHLQEYDLIIDLQNNFRSKKMRNNINSKKVIKFKKPTLKKFLLVNYKLNLLKERTPITERYSAVIDNLILDDLGLDLFIPGSINSKIIESNNYVGLCPGSRHYTKMWPEDYFVELGNMLTERGFKILMFGGKEDETTCGKISSRINGAANLSNDNNLLQTAVDMKKCDVIICNDSGLMHTACAVNVPVIVFFGSTVREFGFAPYKTKNLVLENNLLSCRPCSHIGRNKCPKKHFSCMNKITPEVVLDNFNKFYKNL